MTILYYMRYRSSIMPPSPYPVATPEWKDAAVEHKLAIIRKKKAARLKREEALLIKKLLEALDD